MLEPGAMLSIGPLNFSASILSVVLALILYGIWIKRVEAEREGVQSFLQAGSNALLAALILYKLWPVLEAGKAVWLQPSRWLLYSGGAYGLEAAAAGGVLVFGLQVFRGKWPLERTIEWTLTAIAFLAAAYSIVVKQYGVETEGWGWVMNGSYYLPVNALQAGVMVLLMAMLTFSRSRAHFVRRERIGLLLMGIGLWAILYVTLSPTERIQAGWQSYREEMGLAAVYAGAWLLLRRRG
ncbi:hypothetical protein [Brevibacillus borstelensis]|uniref:hypothetical protein n=1 Tax=Brevibacillus borstelensis TaxID=45462 RepID=UPI003D1E9803